MKLLILGGTIFLGRSLTEAALAQGHTVTLFNRGQHFPDLFPQVEHLHGDRGGDLSALEGRRWDAVIDTCGYIPRAVRASAELLANAVDHYTFISSISAYADASQLGLTEDAPVATMADPTIEQVTGETYGPLKVLCEQAAETALPGRTLIIRPGLIVGPHDFSDRFPYWPERIARGGEVLAPAPPEQRVQIIDVRDLAEWILRLVEQRTVGIFNACGPAEPLTMGTVLDRCLAVANNDAHLTWVSEAFLVQAGVGPWMELPLWIPLEAGKSDRGIMEASMAKAVAAGLTFRPLDDTIQATLAWSQSRPATDERRAGMKPEREQELLDQWHAQGN